jgi:tight adherence protein B
MKPQLLIIILMLASMLLLLTLAFSGPSSGKMKDRRLALVNSRHRGDAAALLETQTRRSITSDLHKSKSSLLASLIPNPQNLAKRLDMTGKKWPLNKYLAVCLAICVGVAAFGVLKGWTPLMALFLGSATGLGLPHQYVSRLIEKRVKAFVSTFPDALDLMVRGLRSGLPVTETLGIIASEIDGPVGEEFRLVSERIKIGKTIDQSFQETAERLGTPEFQFFCITLNIQRETGGNLAETLSNLSKVLRQRAQMKLKIKAMSSEAKASAYIIGALPFAVFAMMCLVNYKYISEFFVFDPAGVFGLTALQLAGLGGMIWMAIGAFIMAQMVNFEV